jgi:Holliday junction resolvasome RuvABC endonuclease subunit
MILGVDPGLATFGWARVDDRGRPLALGVMLTESMPRIEKSLDRASRAAWLAEQLTAQAQGCRLIVGEAMSFPRQHNAITALALGWGVLAAVAVHLGTPLGEVPPKVWQGAIATTDYVALERRLTDHVRRCGSEAAMRALRTIPARHRLSLIHISEPTRPSH